MSESNFHDASFNHSILKDQESFDHMWATKLSLACLFIVESDQYITSVPTSVLSETRTPCFIRLQKFPKSHFHLYFLPSFCNISAFK